MIVYHHPPHHLLHLRYAFDSAVPESARDNGWDCESRSSRDKGQDS